MITIVIADDHPIVRSGIKAVLEAENDLQIVGEAQDGEAAFLEIEKSKPNVAVVDMSMPILNGIGLLEKLHENNIDVNVILLSNYDDEEYILNSIKLGAKAYLLKDVDLDFLVQTIRIVKNGTPFYSQKVAQILANQLNKKDNDEEALTNSEHNILKEIYKGNSSKMIADILNISQRTVETHRYRIMKKMNAQNSADLIRIAIEKKLV